jgi:hypothetical protein
MLKLGLDDISSTITTESEFESPESAGDKDFADAVRTLRSTCRSVWNWCQVVVCVRPRNTKVYQGEQSLGQCSYKNKQDYIDNSGYYEDMIKEATDDLNRQIKKKIVELVETGAFNDNESIAKDLESLADGESDYLGVLLRKAAKALRFEYID